MEMEMEMEIVRAIVIFTVWIIFSVVVGLMGRKRKIGFWWAFLLSFLLSPILGLTVVLYSQNKKDEAYKGKKLQSQRRQQEALNLLVELKQSDSSKNSVANELEKLKKLRDEGVITEAEFEKLKNKLINS
jgi:cell shape-determining protein MreC